MLRRVFPLLTVLLFCSSNVSAQTNFAEAALARSFPIPPVRARAAIVLDASSGTVMAAVNAHARLPIASTTKIMTAIVALQRGQLTDRITVPSAAFNFESDATIMGLHPGQIVTLRDLLYGLMLPSGADAANAIAIHYGGSEAGFVNLMNQEAAMLGLHDTHYANAHGLTASNHYSSAFDLAVLAQFASYMPDLMKIADTRSYSWNGHTLVNVNHVLFWYQGVDGIKPGYTNEAGICQVLDARRNGRHVVVVLLHTPDLVTDARNLLNFGLRDFTWQQSSVPTDGPMVVQSGVDRGESYVYYPGSGHYMRGRFLTTFAADGGLRTLGYPRTEPLTEGRTRVQFFQNGALAQDSPAGSVHRLALGLTPLPVSLTSTQTSTPVPYRTPTGVRVTPTPREATVTPRDSTRSGRTGAPSTKATVTPRPATTTTTAVPALAVAPVFAAFQAAHHGLLGSVVAPVRTVHGYSVQLFAYGALVRDNRWHTVMLLPIGDRLLASRHYLPGRPGDRYPVGFAPGSVLKAIGWDG